MPEEHIINWSLNMPQLLLTIVGFLVAFWFIRYRDNLFTKRENRQAKRQLQEWFHENYIVNGVEPVFAYVSKIRIMEPIEDNLRAANFSKRLPHNQPDFPMLELNRLNKIVGDNLLKVLIV